MIVTLVSTSLALSRVTLYIAVFASFVAVASLKLLTPLRLTMGAGSGAGGGAGRSSLPPLLIPEIKPANPSPAAAGIHQGIAAVT